MDAREGQRLLQHVCTLRLRGLERRLAVRDPARVAGEDLDDLLLRQTRGARGAERNQKRRRLLAVRVVGRVEDLLGRDEPEEAEEESKVEVEVSKDQWKLFIQAMSPVEGAVPFVRVFDVLRGLRNQGLLDLSNKSFTVAPE